MGLQTILSLIEEETEEEIRRIRTDAIDRCEEIRRAARHTIDREADRIRRDGERRAEVLERKVLLSAEYDSMKAEREARWLGIHTAFSLAVQEIGSLSASPDYPDILRTLIIEGQRVIGGGTITVLCREGDRAATEEAIVGLDDLTIRSIPVNDPMIRSGGVILISGDGTVRCDQTFSTRTARMRDLLTQQVSLILYGGGDDRS